MPHSQLNRHKLNIRPLSERPNKQVIERDYIRPGTGAGNISEAAAAVIAETEQRIRKARDNSRPVMMAFGAHAIKNGLGPLLVRMLEEGWITHLATNGAGIIHDWEFAYQGESSEDVRANVDQGQFGIWQETGFYLNLAIAVGAWEGLGYGESVGAMIENESLLIPEAGELIEMLKTLGGADPPHCAAAADLLELIRRNKLPGGRMEIPHPHKQYSVQAGAYRLGIPFTSHPMFGHDIIYTHPMSCGAAIGRTAERDFLAYAAAVNKLEGGVYLSVGSAVMSPMVFEKSLSMAQNLHIQQGGHIDNHFMVVVDLAEASWDWSTDGEPPMDNPAYYLRYCKTFNRMGGEMRYCCADNRDFLLQLAQQLGVG
jgi:hypothetical protein